MYTCICMHKNLLHQCINSTYIFNRFFCLFSSSHVPDSLLGVGDKARNKKAKISVLTALMELAF